MSFRTFALPLVLCMACSTAPRSFETPAGPRPGDQTGPFRILGVISRNTSTLNRADARTIFEESVDVNVPPGTELIVPALRGFILGYGSMDPEDLANAPFDASMTWHPDDHHLGFEAINIFVDRINAVDTSSTPPTQTARIRVVATLTDNNADDRWFGDVNYTLFCLGREP